MKAHLLYPERDFDVQSPRPANESDLTADLALEALLRAMAGGDKFVGDVARKVVLTGLDDPDDIRYRQAILADCVEQPETVRAMYAIAVEAIDRERRVWPFGLENNPGSLLSRSIQVLRIFLESLRQTANDR